MRIGVAEGSKPEPVPNSGEAHATHRPAADRTPAKAAS
jgi:hypothetical protein